MIRPLEEVLAYEHEDLVHRFAADHGVSVADADELFLETKRWLWLCATQIEEARTNAAADTQIPLFSEANAIDEMWHTFLLFTVDYMLFCHRYFGFFVHHRPRTRAEKEEWEKQIAEDPDAARAQRRAQLRAAYATICDRLGTDTLKRWCEDFPARFDFRPGVAGGPRGETPASGKPLRATGERV